ncbi:MAG: WD40 repeat domain-containing serine/threonine-protein kinase [Isosphaerales bacterium]
MPNETSCNGLPTAPDDPESPEGEPQNEGMHAQDSGNLAPAEEATAERWLDELIAEQRGRWLRGERHTCRAYLAREDHPITSNRLAAAELIYHEFLLRDESGEAPEFEEHIRRYPEYASELLIFREADHALDQSLSPLRVGEISRVGDYELLEVVARGGMGVVFKARQASLNRIVALKMIPDGRLASPDQLERLRIEATAAAGLSHPNIVAVHHVGDHAGQPYIVMEYVEGTSLAALAREHPLAAAQAAGYLLKVAEAVHHAHEHGTLHRDLKPSNIIIDDRGAPRITDFGLARLLGGDSHLTITGQALGTPSYMPPEQADHKRGEVGPASDVYGLGATLYELLTGRPPFQAETPLETLKLAIETDPVSPRLLIPKVPRDLETICLKCLQKDPLQRYASAQDLADDLRRFLEGWPVRARRDRWWERGLKLLKRRRMEVALAIALFAVIVVVIWLRFAELRHRAEHAKQQLALTEERANKEKADAEARAARQMAEWQEYRALENGVREKRASRTIGWTWSCLGDLARAAQLSPEVRNLVDLRREAAICLAGVDLRRVTTWVMPDDAQVDCVAFSPDGRRLAMAQLRGVVARQLRLVDLTSGSHQDLIYPGPVQKDARDTGGGSLAFSPDGRWLVIGTRQGDIYAWDTSGPRPKRCDLEGAHRQWVTGLAFSPDGRTLVSCSEDKTIRCWELSSRWRNVRTIAVDRGYTGLAFSPDGTKIACCSSRGLTIFNAEELAHGDGFHSPSRREFLVPRSMVLRISPDGRLVVTTDGRRRLVLLEAESLNPIRTLRDPDLDDSAHEHEITNLDFTPDGSLLLSSSWDRTVKLWEVATGRLLVTTKEVPADREIVFAAFSPQGRHMAVTNGTQTAIYELGGLEEQTIMAHHSDPVHAIDFAPDGRTLACVADRGLVNQEHRGELTIWDIESGSLKAKQAITGRCAGEVRGSVSFDPEGTLLAFGHSSRELCLARFLPRNERSSVGVEEPPSSLVFSRDGQTLWAGVGRRLVSWRMPDLSLASQWSNDLGEYLKGWSGIASVAAGKQWVVAGCQDDSTRVFPLRDGTQPVQTWPSPGGSVGSVALSRDEVLAVLGTLSGRVRVARVPGGEPVADLAGHTDEVTSVALCPDDHLLATASLDRTIRLWRRQGDSFQELLSLPSPSGVVAVRFSPKGDRLAFVVKNETAVRIWHLARLKYRLDTMNLGW